MSTKINLKDKKMSLTAIFIIVFGYASERLAEKRLPLLSAAL